MKSQSGVESAPRAGVEPLSFGVALGHRLRQVREGTGRTAAEVAAASKRLGLGWDRSTVARIELGQRQVTAPELLVMTVLYGVSVADLLPTEDVRLTETVTATADGLRDHLSRGGLGRGVHVEGLREEVMAGLERVKRTFPAIRDRLPGACDWDLIAGAGYVSEEATVKAAKRLGATAEEVAVASSQLWGRSLTAERDARVEAMGPAATKARQARRGHVTRALLTELAPQVVHVRTGEGETDGER